MEYWYTEEHSENVRFSIRVDKQLYSAKSTFQRIDIFEAEEFGRFLTLDGLIPSLIFPSRIARFASSSQSKTLAGPEKWYIDGSIAMGFVIPVPGARLPRITARPPDLQKGSSFVRITRLSTPKGLDQSSRFSPRLFPLTVMQERSISFSSSFMTCGMPPAR